MKCFYCRGDLESGMTSHVVTFEHCVIVVRDVPCSRCAQCGEAYFSDEIADELERIVENFRKDSTEVAVVNYAAARV